MPSPLATSTSGTKDSTVIVIANRSARTPGRSSEAAKSSLKRKGYGLCECVAVSVGVCVVCVMCVMCVCVSVCVCCVSLWCLVVSRGVFVVGWCIPSRPPFLLSTNAKHPPRRHSEGHARWSNS